MQVKKIDLETIEVSRTDFRPVHFEDFIGQEDITRVVKTAIASSKKSKRPLGHMLLLWAAWYGKTTLSQIISHTLWTNCKVVTAYAITKPADIISLLNALGEWDVLFIDEIHRLAPKIEEMLYTAMEDYVIDMVMPDGGHVKIPLQAFTLIGATTKSDHLSKPLKSRFIYKFHFSDYTDVEKQKIIWYYMRKLGISPSIPLWHEWAALPRQGEAEICEFAKLVENIPRELHNACVRMYDYLNVHHKTLELTNEVIAEFASWNNSREWWLNTLHQTYLEVLDGANKPLSLNTIAVKLGLDEKMVEEEIEPLLIKLGYVERGPRWRVICN